jgi:hypothetical protein
LYWGWPELIISGAPFELAATLPGVALWTWEDNVSRFDRLEREAFPWSEKP